MPFTLSCGEFFRGQGAGMSNWLTMAQTQAIQALAAMRQSNRAISRALGVDRGTVAKTLSQIQNQPPAWEAPTGFGDTPAGFQDTDPVVQTGFTPVAESDVETYSASITANSSSTTVDVETPAGSRSEFEPYRDEIVRKLKQGLTAQRIWQALSDEYGFPAKYHSVRRYVVRLRQKMPQLVRRMEVAVKQADRYDSETHPKLQSFAPHYGAVFLPTKPYTPEHNGKVEAGVKYVKNNGLKGYEFASLEA